MVKLDAVQIPAGTDMNGRGCARQHDKKGPIHEEATDWGKGNSSICLGRLSHGSTRGMAGDGARRGGACRIKSRKSDDDDVDDADDDDHLGALIHTAMLRRPTPRPVPPRHRVILGRPLSVRSGSRPGESRGGWRH